MSETTATNGNGTEAETPVTAGKLSKASQLAPIKAAWEAAGSRDPGPDEAKQLKGAFQRALAKHAADLKAADESRKVMSEAAYRIMLATGARTVTIDGVDNVPMCRDGHYFFRKRSNRPSIEL